MILKAIKISFYSLVSCIRFIIDIFQDNITKKEVYNKRTEREHIALWKKAGVVDFRGHTDYPKGKNYENI